MNCCTSIDADNKSIYSCEVMVDYRTCLCPPSKKNTKVLQLNTVDAKIEKVCATKIIIGGTIHKTIVYTDIFQCEDNNPNQIKQKDIPFSCYIDVCNINMENSYKIVQTQIECSYAEIIREENGCCCEEVILADKNIVKIVVQRTTNSDNSNNMKKCKFCGKTIVDCEINFHSPVKPCKASISVGIDPNNIDVKLACCDFVVVSGFFTKTIKFSDGTPTVKKTIPFHVEIPVDMCHCDDVNCIDWKITKAEVCIISSNFTCTDEDSDLFHKLVEKDIVVVQIEP